MSQPPWQIHNPEGTFRVIVTKALPGRRWLDILIAADCRIEVCHSAAVLSTETIKAAIGSRCDGAIGQLTEPALSGKLPVKARKVVVLPTPLRPSKAIAFSIR